MLINILNGRNIKLPLFFIRIEDANTRHLAVEVQARNWLPVVVLEKDCTIAFSVAERDVSGWHLRAANRADDIERRDFLLGGHNTVICGYAHRFFINLRFGYASGNRL